MRTVIKTSLKPLFFSFVLFLILGMTALHAVKIEFHSFEDKAQEQVYLKLIAELRCVKCQNQNLAESNADLAKQMRDKTYEIISNGGTREDVIQFMTARYGDFVLYQPPFKKQTFLLWIAPPLFLFFGLLILLRIVRKQKDQPNTVLSDAERDSVRELLSSKKEN